MHSSALVGSFGSRRWALTVFDIAVGSIPWPLKRDQPFSPKLELVLLAYFVIKCFVFRGGGGSQGGVTFNFSRIKLRTKFDARIAHTNTLNTDIFVLSAALPIHYRAIMSLDLSKINFRCCDTSLGESCGWFIL